MSVDRYSSGSELESEELGHCLSKSEIVIEWKDKGTVSGAKGSNGSFSSSSSLPWRTDERRDELDVSVRGELGTSGAAMASLEVALRVG
jgi:hypothetical protein